MTNKIIEHSLEIANKEVSIPKEEVPEDLADCWPEEAMWMDRNGVGGQKDVVYRLLETDKPTFLCSPTGSGKTAIMVTIAKKKVSEDSFGNLIIVHRKNSQDEFSKYGVFPIFGKTSYTCNLSATESSISDNVVTADKGPCEYKKKGYIFCPVFDDWCKRPNQPRKDCIYDKCPCFDCSYRNEKQKAVNFLEEGKPVVCNAWNFYAYLNKCNKIIIDEAEAVIDAINNPRKLKRVSTDKISNEVIELIEMELNEINVEYNTLDEELGYVDSWKEYQKIARKKIQLERDINNLIELKRVHDACFKYEKDGAIHVEVNPDEIEVMINRLFERKVIILASATPSNDKFDELTYEIPHRSVIYYDPVNKLTKANYKKNPRIIGQAVEKISIIYDSYYDNNLTQKAVIHCGNLEWAQEVGEKLKNKGYTVDIHEQGKQQTIINRFQNNETQFLCIVAGEYAINFDQSTINMQFILKVPYAPRDERVKAIAKKNGNEVWYNKNALQKTIQASGRVARGNKFSATFILDSKFNELYTKFKNMIPSWFQERLVYAKNL